MKYPTEYPLLPPRPRRLAAIIYWGFLSETTASKVGSGGAWWLRIGEGPGAGRGGWQVSLQTGLTGPALSPPPLLFVPALWENMSCWNYENFLLVYKEQSGYVLFDVRTAPVSAVVHEPACRSRAMKWEGYGKGFFLGAMYIFFFSVECYIIADSKDSAQSWNLILRPGRYDIFMLMTLRHTGIWHHFQLPVKTFRANIILGNIQESSLFFEGGCLHWIDYTWRAWCFFN